MENIQSIKNDLVRYPKKWLITGVAGFVGSNLLEELLRLKQQVVGLDNFSTGKHTNLQDVREVVGEVNWKNFRMVEGDIRHISTCRRCCADVELVLHQAALGSVPRSVEKPLLYNENNVDGTLNLFKAAHENAVKRVVFASSSAVYGDDPKNPKTEDQIGNPLSPYAITKRINELYAHVFSQLYGLESIGLRYFNVFGPRQDPAGAYAAVIPCWIKALSCGEPVQINGTGETSRDFCYIANVVQANLLAALTSNQQAVNQIYNIALNSSTSLNKLYLMLEKRLLAQSKHHQGYAPIYREFRPGDILHSQADISKARKLLCYTPTHTISEGIDAALGWYINNLPA